MPETKLEQVWVQNLKGFIAGTFPANEQWKRIFVERIDALLLDRQDLIDALQPLLGCADYAREHDLSGHETLVVTASEAYEANSIHERVLNRAAKAGGDNG